MSVTFFFYICVASSAHKIPQRQIFPVNSRSSTQNVKEDFENFTNKRRFSF